MGVADNKSYKDMYHFNTGFYGTMKLKDVPSINVDPDINSTIKKNPYLSNVEIEGDELVLEPDLTALYKARGKKHSQGGMDVNLKPNSFIFSDDGDLSFDEKDHKMFELKEGGNFNKTTNTPADVLKRNVDAEHYNKMMSILDDPKKDDLSKKSAARMMEKYIQTLGNVAYIQEQKKGFPTGIPDFSMNTAPIYDASLKDDIMSQKQYAKYGGEIMAQGGQGPEDPYKKLLQFLMPDNPFNKKVTGIVPPFSSTETSIPQQDQRRSVTGAPGNNWGLWKGDQLPGFKDRYGVSNAADKITNLDNLAQRLGYTGPKDNKTFQQWLYNSSPENKAIIDKWHNAYNVGPNNGMFDGKFGIRWTDALNEMAHPRTPGEPEMTPYGHPTINPPADNIPGRPVIGSPDQPLTESPGKEINWQFTPWQRISQAYNASKYAGAQRYMPARTHINPGYIDPQLVNPEQAIGDMKSGANSQIGALSSLSPVLRNAQSSDVYGQFLNRTPGVRSQYDNQNAGITNQFRQYNNQIENNSRAQNAQYDANYYQQTVTGRQNFDNMKTFLGDQYMNNLMGDVQTDQSLAYNLASQRNPAYGFDFKTGNFYRNPKSILDVQGSNSMDEYKSAMQYVNSITDPAKRADAYIKLLGVKSLGSAINQPQGTLKKGGKFRGNKI